MSALPTIDPEYSSMLPPLTGEEYGILEQNILSDKKCRNPIVVWDGAIVRGHARFEICLKHGIEFEIVEMSFQSKEDAKRWILEEQLGRRNLTDAQKLEIALFRADLLRITAKKNRNKIFPKVTKAENEPINVLAAVADEAGVGKGTAERYLKVRDEAGPELLEQVQLGEVTIGTAHRRLDSEVLKQLKKANDRYAFIEGCLPFGDETDAEVSGRLQELAALVEALIQKRRERRAEKLGYSLED
jgi:hypothetical protein